MKAYISLIKQAIKAGNTISVWDGEEWQVKRSTGFKAIVEAVKSVEEAQLRLRDANGDITGSAWVSAYGLEDDETIIDHSCNPYMEELVAKCYGPVVCESLDTREAYARCAD